MHLSSKTILIVTITVFTVLTGCLSAYQDELRFSTAKSRAERGERYEAAGKDLKAAGKYNSAARLYYTGGDYASASKYYSKAAKLYKNNGDKRSSEVCKYMTRIISDNGKTVGPISSHYSVELGANPGISTPPKMPPRSLSTPDSTECVIA